ncbi:MAG: prephenate dehydrogenase [Eubacteriales bacterium]|jgi:prephenate dehydrogenase|nr:prephenate dehydrogenase [Eubacteriales bacterium]
MKNMTVTIVGLGLIGGSIARSLCGKVGKLFAIDKDESVLDFAKKQGLIDKTDQNPLPISDMVILCIYPCAAEQFVKENLHSFKKGAILTDAIGVKTPLMQLYNKLEPDFAYIGGHPMAGREVGGFINSLDNLFEGASFIITACKGATRAQVDKVRQLAMAIGCGRVIETTVENHDRIIAYTSQLPHVIATAMCDTPLLVKHKNYTGGSFEDVTRVAKINEFLWSELFLANKEFLIEEIDRFQHSLERLKSAIANDDKDKLQSILAKVRKDKEMVDNEEA